MKTLIATALIAAAPAFALASDCPADLNTDTVLGTDLDSVKAALTSMGYEVRKGETEDGKIEVYFVKEKIMGEVYVSPKTGKITKMECNT